MAKSRTKLADCRGCRRPVFSNESILPTADGASWRHTECPDLPQSVEVVPESVEAPAEVVQYSGMLSHAVGSALSSITVSPEDRGAVALARRYAALMDDAAPAAKYGEALIALRGAVEFLRQLDPLAWSYLGRYMTKVENALAAHSVASDLGPKLLATLTALGMTVTGRGVRGGAPGVVSAVESKIDELRARRERRAGVHGA